VQKIEQTAAYIRSQTNIRPQFVIVLGSGLGSVADDLTEAVVLPYESVPHFHVPGVQGHAGRLVMGNLSGIPVMVMQVGGSGQELVHKTQCIFFEQFALKSADSS
jgi:purine-nucleoside phosphorylase